MMPVVSTSRYTEVIWALACPIILPCRLFKKRHKLLQNTQALTNLIHADQVAIIGVAVITHSNIEIEVVVDAIWVSAAQVVGNAAGAQYWTGHAIGNRDIGWQNADTLAARDDDFVGGQQVIK